jgi:hypothetical protein
VVDQVLLLHPVAGDEPGALEGGLGLVPLRLRDRESASVRGNALQAADTALAGRRQVRAQRLVEVGELLVLADQPGRDRLDPLDPADLAGQARGRLLARRHRVGIGGAVIDQKPRDPGGAQEERVELVARALGPRGQHRLLARLAAQHLGHLAQHPQVVRGRRGVVRRERLAGALREAVAQLGELQRLGAREDAVAVVVDERDVAEVEQHQNL